MSTKLPVINLLLCCINVKKYYYSNLIEQAAGNSQKTWQIINEATGRACNEKIVPTNVTENTVNDFNTYFTNVGTSLDKMLPRPSKASYEPISMTNSFVINHIELYEILSIASKLVMTNAPALDEIPAHVIKDNIDIFGHILCDLFNPSLHTGIYPSTFKIAKFTPIYRKGDRSDPSCYRTISVLSVLNNTFEKIIVKHMHLFLDK